MAGGGAAWPTALRDSLVAFWALDEASGTRADSIGSNTLTDNNTVGSDTGLVYDTAADFVVANSEYLSRADNAALSTGDIDFWLAAWAYLDNKAGTRPFIMKANWSVTDGEYQLFYRFGSDRFEFLILNGSTNNDVVANQFGSPSTGTWYLLTAWHDATNNQLGIQVNGGTPDTAATTIAPQDAAYEFRLGHASDGVIKLDGRIGPAMLGKNYIPTAEDRSFLWNGGSGRKL